MGLMAVLGILVGTQVNRGIYRLAWYPRHIGPWSAPHAEAPARRPSDLLPILGWWNLRRESLVHSRGFWIRPLLIELAMGIGFAFLYWWEIEYGGVNRSSGFTVVPAGLINPTVLHLQLFSHIVLISLMMVATFIDLDEQTIPDAITIPGTLLGLSIAALFPVSRTLVAVPAPVGFAPEFLHLCTATGRPNMSSWPTWLDEFPGLAIGVGCFIAWCLAILPATWTLRRGFTRAVRFWFASLRRRAGTRAIAGLACVGVVAIATVWWLGGTRWESLLSSLVGLAVGGGIIWAVRIVGTMALQQEAMGFGDVTLMAMIGTFTGWQPTLIIFFMAPFSALLIAIIQFAISRRHDIAFGPYLCLSALVWSLRSGEIWREYGLPIFTMGWYVPTIGLFGLVLLGGMLKLYLYVRDALFPYIPDEDELPSLSVPVRSAGNTPADGTSFEPSNGAGQEHPLRRTISLQPKDGLIPGTRQLGHIPSASQLFRR